MVPAGGVGRFSAYTSLHWDSWDGEEGEDKAELPQRGGLFLMVRKCEARESCVLERYRGFLILNVILDKILC